VAIYEGGCWTVNKDIAKRLTASEREVLKRIFGEIKVNQDCRKRYNKELMQLFGELITCEYGKEPSGSIKCGEFLN
jgi:hypothetical protein